MNSTTDLQARAEFHAAKAAAHTRAANWYSVAFGLAFGAGVSGLSVPIARPDPDAAWAWFATIVSALLLVLWSVVFWNAVRLSRRARRMRMPTPVDGEG